MLIGQISKISGLSRDTIRFYEKIGLIEAQASESPFNNYKNYTTATLERLQWIKRAKKFGFTLQEISELLTSMEENKATCSFLYEKVTTKISSIEEEIRILVATKKRIVENLDLVQRDCQLKSRSSNCSSFLNVK